MHLKFFGVTFFLIQFKIFFLLNVLTISYLELISKLNSKYGFSIFLAFTDFFFLSSYILHLVFILINLLSCFMIQNKISIEECFLYT